MLEQEKTETRRALWRLFGPHVAVAALVVAGAGLAVLYGMGGRSGKEAASCDAALATAARLKPLATGEVAAFNPTRAPKALPDIPFNGPDGKPTSLAALRGKTVLLNLWATWCVPCRTEMPALDRLQAAEGGKDFEVVAVNIDTRNLDKPKAFLAEIGVKSLAFYADPKADILQSLKKATSVLGLPTTILIDPKGCEIGVMAGPAEWDRGEAVALVKAAKGG